jgi:hypothetical protein
MFSVYNDRLQTDFGRAQSCATNNGNLISEVMLTANEPGSSGWNQTQGYDR